MSAKLPVTPKEWVDPDDAPELTDEFFEKATPKIGGKPVSIKEAKEGFAATSRRGRPKAERPKTALTVRYDADIVETFKAMGKGWQTRMNSALRDWLRTHSPE